MSAADTSGAYRRHECPRCADLEAKAIGEEQDRRTLERWATLANERADRANETRRESARQLPQTVAAFGLCVLTAEAGLRALGLSPLLSGLVALAAVSIAVAIGTRGAS